ncbi:MAG: hypothetical protein KDB97_00035, partial [Flavobacteriales bacterium]|nr:hypothetical protein [Flavobacteriales bacterium]
QVILGREALIDTLGARADTGAFARVTPFRATMAYSVAWQSGWTSTFSLSQRAIAGYMPLARLLIERALGEQIVLGVSGQYGGFGELRAGLRFVYACRDRLFLELDAPNLATAFGPNGRGRSLAVAVSYAW